MSNTSLKSQEKETDFWTQLAATPKWLVHLLLGRCQGLPVQPTPRLWLPLHSQDPLYQGTDCSPPLSSESWASQSLSSAGPEMTPKLCSSWCYHLQPDILECEVKWALGSITTNKASRGDGIPLELFQILKDDAVKVLHSICQQIWKTQQWPQDWKRSIFIPIPKKGNAKECSNYRTIALISHASKVMIKILRPNFNST